MAPGLRKFFIYFLFGLICVGLTTKSFSCDGYLIFSPNSEIIADGTLYSVPNCMPNWACPSDFVIDPMYKNQAELEPYVNMPIIGNGVETFSGVNTCASELPENCFQHYFPPQYVNVNSPYYSAPFYCCNRTSNSSDTLNCTLCYPNITSRCFMEVPFYTPKRGMVEYFEIPAPILPQTPYMIPMTTMPASPCIPTLPVLASTTPIPEKSTIPPPKRPTIPNTTTVSTSATTSSSAMNLRPIVVEKFIVPVKITQLGKETEVQSSTELDVAEVPIPKKEVKEVKEAKEAKEAKETKVSPEEEIKENCDGEELAEKFG